MEPEKLYAMPFSRLYPCYAAKAERKGRTRAEVDTVLKWITGYGELPMDCSLRAFFENAPALNPALEKIGGSICGVKIDAIEDPLMKRIRQTDKLIDGLSKGKSLEKLLNI